MSSSWVSSQARPPDWRPSTCSSSICASMRASPRAWACCSASLTMVGLGMARASVVDLQLGQQFGLACGLQRVEHVAQVAFHHGQQLVDRSEEHTSELQSPCNLVCRLLLEKKKLRLR